MHGKIYTDGEFGCLKLSDDLGRWSSKQNNHSSFRLGLERQWNHHLNFQLALCGREEKAKDFSFLEPRGSSWLCSGEMCNVGSWPVSWKKKKSWKEIFSYFWAGGNRVCLQRGMGRAGKFCSTSLLSLFLLSLSVVAGWEKWIMLGSAGSCLRAACGGQGTLEISPFASKPNFSRYCFPFASGAWWCARGLVPCLGSLLVWRCCWCCLQV